jgi:hypothetical protein
MDVDEIKSIVWSLAQSTGLYGRLGRDLDECDGWDEIARRATEAGCKSEMDFILWYEGG